MQQYFFTFLHISINYSLQHHHLIIEIKIFTLLYAIIRQTQQFVYLLYQYNQYMNQSCISQISLNESIITSTRLDQGESLFQSSTTQKICRKPNQLISRRKTLSRSSSDKSQTDENINRFYIKMNQIGPGPNLEFSRKNYHDTINNQQQNQNKTRTPTPVPGHIAKIKPHKNQENTQIKYELEIAEITKRFQKQKSQKQSLLKNISIYEKQLKVKINRIKDLQKAMLELNNRSTESQLKMRQYQKNLRQNQKDLKQTKSNLQKLKQTITKTRINELQLQNNNIRNENIKLKEANVSLHKSLEILNHQHQQHQRQLLVIIKQKEILAQKVSFSLKKPMETQLVYATFNDKERIKDQEKIAEMINSKNLQIIQLTKKLQTLQMQNIHLNRKKNEQIEQLKESKRKEVEKIRQKLLDVHSQYIVLKQDYNTMRRERKELPKRSMMRKQSNGDENFLLELSP